MLGRPCRLAESLLSTKRFVVGVTQGFVEGCEIECPMHNAVFDVTSGKYLRGEPCRDLKTFAVRVVDARIEVQL